MYPCVFEPSLYSESLTGDKSVVFVLLCAAYRCNDESVRKQDILDFLRQAEVRCLGAGDVGTQFWSWKGTFPMLKRAWPCCSTYPLLFPPPDISMAELLLPCSCLGGVGCCDPEVCLQVHTTTTCTEGCRCKWEGQADQQLTRTVCFSVWEFLLYIMNKQRVELVKNCTLLAYFLCT